jgi:L-lysine 6-transaminase
MEIVEEEGLVARAAVTGERLRDGLVGLTEKYRGVASNVRGLGIYQGFSLDTPARKAALISTALQQFNLLLLGAGTQSIRTRPNLSVTGQDVDEFIARLDQALAAVA